MRGVMILPASNIWSIPRCVYLKREGAPGNEYKAADLKRKKYR